MNDDKLNPDIEKFLFMFIDKEFSPKILVIGQKKIQSQKVKMFGSTFLRELVFLQKIGN